MKKIVVLIMVIVFLSGCSSNKQEEEKDYQAQIDEFVLKVKDDTAKIVLSKVDYENESDIENNICSITWRTCDDLEENRVITDKDVIDDFLNDFENIEYQENTWLALGNNLIQFYDKDDKLIGESGEYSIAFPNEPIELSKEIIEDDHLDFTNVDIRLNNEIIEKYFVS